MFCVCSPVYSSCFVHSAAWYAAYFLRMSIPRHNAGLLQRLLRRDTIPALFLFLKNPPKNYVFCQNPYISEPQNLHISKKNCTFALEIKKSCSGYKPVCARNRKSSPVLNRYVPDFTDYVHP